MKIRTLKDLVKEGYDRLNMPRQTERGKLVKLENRGRRGSIQSKSYDFSPEDNARSQIRQYLKYAVEKGNMNDGRIEGLQRGISKFDRAIK